MGRVAWRDDCHLRRHDHRAQQSRESMGVLGRYESRSSWGGACAAMAAVALGRRAGSTQGEGPGARIGSKKASPSGPPPPTARATCRAGRKRKAALRRRLGVHGQPSTQRAAVT